MHCSAQKGKITEADVTCVFRCKEHAPSDSLVEPFQRIEEIVDKAMTTTLRPPQAIGEVTRPYEDGDRRSFSSYMILCMLGSWLTRRPRQW